MSIQITNDSSIIVYDNAVVGPQGNQGPQGSQGSQGHQGFQGSDTANNRVLKAGDTMTGNLNFSNTFVIAANVNFLGGEPATLLTTNTASGSSNLPLIMHATGANASVLSFWLSHPDDLANSYVGGISVNPEHTSNGSVRILTGQYTGPTYKWDFQNDGEIEFPLLYSDRGDISSGTIYGNTLKFANSTYQAIITGPEGTATNPSAERMVIEGGKGYTGTGGEGGDIYLWAGRGGDAGGTGGDIKIRGGYGYSEGGYIRIDGGDTAAGPGGYVEVTGGSSATDHGGEIRLIGGYGANGYGNVRITSASNNWLFASNGNLTLPGQVHGFTTYGGGGVPNGRAVDIVPADDASDKKFKFRIDQYGETFTRAFFEMPEAQNNKQVAIAFPHANSNVGYIFTQGADTYDDGLNNAFNIFYNAGDIKVTAMTPGTGVFNTWKFGNNGVLTVPTTASGWGRIAGNNLVITGEKDDMYSAQVYLPNNADSANDPAGIYNAGDAGVEIGAGGIHNWKFANTGILKMPKAINFQQNATIPLGKPAVNGANDRITLWDFEGGGSGYNYAIGAEGNHIWFTMDVDNGTGGFKFYSRDNQVFKIRDDGALIFSDNTVQTTAYTGGGGNTANVTFNDNIVIGTGVGQNDGLYLAAGAGQVANLQYLRLRGGDDDAHIHFDTANTEAYDFYIGDDSKYVKLERGIAGNVVIGTYGAGNKTWTFANTGEVIFPDNSVQNTAYDLITASTQTGSAVLSDFGGTINTITNGTLSLRVVSDSGTAANLQYSINDTVVVKGRTKITTSSSITPSAVSPAGVTTAAVWYSLGTVSNEGDLIESVITDHSYHNVYRITFVARQINTGPNTATGYAAIERLQRG